MANETNNPHNIQLGQILWDYKLKEYRVQKIAKNYFYTDVIYRNSPYNFSLDKLRFKHPSYGDLSFSLYLDKQALIDEKETKRLRDKLVSFFSWNGKQKELTLEQLKAIYAIISQPNQ